MEKEKPPVFGVIQRYGEVRFLVPSEKLWLRPHRGILQEKIPFYIGFFEFVHYVGKREKALLHSLIEVLVN